MAFSYPISTELREFAQQNPRFADSLKMLNDERFITLNTIILSYPETLPEGSQVIGVFYADVNVISKGRGPKFKQDYIVKSSSGEFASYTATKSPNKNVRPLGEFRAKVAKGGLYGSDKGEVDHHYYSINELPDPIQDEARIISHQIEGGTIKPSGI